MTTQHKRIYIAGPTPDDVPELREHLQVVANFIAGETNLIPVHTAWVRTGISWSEYMELAYELLGLCDLICVVPGWGSNAKTQEELKVARDAGLPVIELHKIADEFGR